VWSQYLTKGLKARGFIQSGILDECVFYCGKLILMVYVDDCILMSPDNQDIDDVIELLKKRIDGAASGPFLMSPMRETYQTT
jgi:hypothetical protein